MKLSIVALSLFLAMSIAQSAEIQVSGLLAKSLMDTLLSNEKLSVFRDGGMGKIYFSASDIVCSKNTFPGKEMIACTFHDESNVVNLYSDVDQGMEEIRYVLVESSDAEIQSTETMKELKIKNLDCKVSGLGHVLDDNSTELNYRCRLSI